MAISEFVQKAVFQLYGRLPVEGLAGLGSLRFENPVDQFIAELRNSRAKVFVNKHDYYFSAAFGPISERLRGKTRRQIRKSLAFLRIREYANYNFRAQLGVAGYAALLISKNDMIHLQLINQCRFARLYISAEDILSSFAQARALIEQAKELDGYYVSGPKALVHTPCNVLRNIEHLTVYVIKKEKTNRTERKIF